MQDAIEIGGTVHARVTDHIGISRARASSVLHLSN